MRERPAARRGMVHSEWIEDELVLYDEPDNRAHCLGATAARVWELCDGSRTSPDISAELGIAMELVDEAIAQIGEAGLLESVGQVTRREATRRIASVGAAAFTAPLLYSVTIGTAIAAASTCMSPSDCHSVIPYTTPTCVGGQCTYPCSEGIINCAGHCTNTQDDVYNCGGCGIQCPTYAPNGMAVCTDATCGIMCDSGYTLCSGMCVNLQTDPSNCGTCTKQCSGPTPYCVMGACKSTPS